MLVSLSSRLEPNSKRQTSIAGTQTPGRKSHGARQIPPCRRLGLDRIAGRAFVRLRHRGDLGRGRPPSITISSTPRGLSEAARDSLSGWAVSCALLGCVIGAAVGGPIANRLGRKGGLMVAAILFLVGSLGSAVPELGLGTDRRHGRGRAHAVHPLSHPGRRRRGIGLDAGAHVHRRNRAARRSRPAGHLAADRHRGRHHAGLFRQLGDRTARQ